MAVTAEEDIMAATMMVSSHKLHTAHKRPPYRPHTHMSRSALVIITWLVVLACAASVAGRRSHRRYREKNAGALHASATSTSKKIVNEEIVVKVFADDWDDMETCPYWCKRDDGSVRCCPEKPKSVGSCPKPKELCVSRSGKNNPDESPYCVDDRACPDKYKCCFDRCVGARICTLAVK